MNSSAIQPTEFVSETLSGSEYNRQRVSPQPKDVYYIHLSDVRLFLADYESETFGSILDYGCGGSPYRSLFKTAQYLRADYVDCGGVDCIIRQDGKLDLPDNSFDLVLSTQVLEHVFQPQDYLKEALRVLKPGGKLLLTTHGVWEEHGCPYDFRRWTGDGLRRELEQAGFQVTKTAKLTTGPRAILFLFSQILGVVHDGRRTLAGLAFRLLRRSQFAKPEWRHRWMDRQFSMCRVALDKEPGHGIYLALGVEAVKPYGQPAAV